MSTDGGDKTTGTPSPSVMLEWRSYLHPPRSMGSNTSSDTVQRPYDRPSTPISIRSLGSVSSSPLRIRSENIQPIRLFSRDASRSVEDASLFPSPQRSSKHSSRKSSRAKDNLLRPRSRNVSTLVQESSLLEEVNLYSPHDINHESASESDKENQHPGTNVKEPRLSFDVSHDEVLSVDEPSRTSNQTKLRNVPTPSAGPRPSRSFKGWINNLRPQPLRRKKTLTVRKKRWPLDESPQYRDIMKSPKTGRRRSEEQKAVVEERPNGSPPPRMFRRSNPFSKSSKSSRRSEDRSRLSAESNALQVAALERTTQRQKTLEELVVSEASYIADLKVLIHVRPTLQNMPCGKLSYSLQAYFTLLALAPNVSQHSSTQIQQNVTEILRLHEDLLVQIQHFVIEPAPHTVRRDLPLHSKHNRRRSVNGHQIASAITGLVHTARTSIETARPSQSKGNPTPLDIDNMIEVAKVFGNMLGRFFVYEEYGAKYELMLREMSLISKSIPNWHAFERSIEALANSLASSSGSEESVRKGLAFEDLLIKPIQRICKYPLLFEDLYNNTLEVDSIESRGELRNILWRLRETAEEINRATNDRETQARIQRSWHLQDLLILPNAVSLLAA